MFFVNSPMIGLALGDERSHAHIQTVQKGNFIGRKGAELSGRHTQSQGHEQMARMVFELIRLLRTVCVLGESDVSFVSLITLHYFCALLRECTQKHFTIKAS